MTRKNNSPNKSKKLRNKPSQDDSPPTTRRRDFWTMTVPAGERILVSDRIMTCMVVIKNHGPGKIAVDARYPIEGFEILPGRLRVMVANAGEPFHLRGPDTGIALAEFRYVPVVR